MSSASKRPHRAATLHDVAREAGVSLMTASRALNNPQLVSDATIGRVHEAVQRTGYIPNLIAGGLKSRRSMTIAGLVPIISVPQFLPTVRALTETFDAAGYQLILGQSGYDWSREEQLIDAMLGRRPDGLVVTGLVHSPAARKKLQQLHIPVVETWEWSDTPIDMLVGFSHRQVGEAVADYIAAKGWKHVGIATGDDERAAHRRAGFIGRLGRDVPTVTVPAPSNVALGRRALAELLEKNPKLRAVSCSSDALAHGVLVEAGARGLRVPQDIAVCGFGDADFSAHLQPSLTTVHIDAAEIGRTAAQLVLDRCHGRPVASPVVDVGFRIIERESTAGPARPPRSRG